MRCVEWLYISIAPSIVCSLVETRAFTQTARAACFLGQHSKVCCCSLLLEGAWPSLSLRMLLLCCTVASEKEQNCLFACQAHQSVIGGAQDTLVCGGLEAFRAGRRRASFMDHFYRVFRGHFLFPLYLAAAAARQWW